jgi:hypothetical protein
MNQSGIARNGAPHASGAIVAKTGIEHNDVSVEGQNSRKVRTWSEYQIQDGLAQTAQSAGFITVVDSIVKPHGDSIGVCAYTNGVDSIPFNVNIDRLKVPARRLPRRIYNGHMTRRSESDRYTVVNAAEISSVAIFLLTILNLLIAVALRESRRPIWGSCLPHVNRMLTVVYGDNQILDQGSHGISGKHSLLARRWVAWRGNRHGAKPLVAGIQMRNN